MQINMLKQTGDMAGKPQVYFELLAAAVFITKVSSKGGEDGGITQDVECVFKEIQLGYKRQTNKGTLDPNKPFGWNVAEMNFNVSGDVKLSIS
jgi:type VI protein secretion system component Hcp